MEQSELLRYAAGILDRLDIPYLVTGSIASIAYGEPRMTIDIDIVIALSPAKVEPLCAAFSGDRFYVSVEAARDAVRTTGQFNVIESETGLKIDFMVASESPFDRSRFTRARRSPLGEDPAITVAFASPEDVIIMKLVYAREGGSDKHLRDITGILRTSRDEIDKSYLADWANRLDVADLWQAVRTRSEGAS